MLLHPELERATVKSPSEGSQWRLPHGCVNDVGLSRHISGFTWSRNVLCSVRDPAQGILLLSAVLKLKKKLTDWFVATCWSGLSDAHKRFQMTPQFFQLLVSRMYLYWLYNSYYSRNLISGIKNTTNSCCICEDDAAIYLHMKWSFRQRVRQPSLLIMNILMKLSTLPTV